MILDGKPFEEITSEDLQEIIGVREDVALEFKEKYENLKTSDGSYEVLKDIAAMANAEGGYIIIGVRENDDHQAVEFVDVENANELTDQIRDLCHGRLETRLLGLQFRHFSANGCSVVVINVPDEEPKPHWIRKGEKYVSIPRRVADAVRYLTMDELRGAVHGDRLSRKLEHIEGRLQSIQRLQSASPKTVTDESFLQVTDPKMVLQHLRKSFKKLNNEKPSFRLILVPEALSGDSPLQQHHTQVVSLVERPPEVRHPGFGITPTETARIENNGCIALNDSCDGGLRLLWNGCAEFWCGADSDYLQWHYHQFKRNSILIDQLPMIESIVCFTRLGNRLSGLLRNSTGFQLHAEFWNCIGAKLILYPPGTVGNRVALSRLAEKRSGPPVIKSLTEEFVSVQSVRLDANSQADVTARELVAHIYRRFGFTEFQVPYFNEEGVFSKV